MSFREDCRERRAFPKFMFAGAGAAAAVAASFAPSLALTWLAPLEPPAQTASPTPEAAVATEVDMERAKVQKSYWHRRRYW